MYGNTFGKVEIILKCVEIGNISKFRQSDYSEGPLNLP